MQIQSQNIQRLKLFFDFFNFDLVWNSEYLEYINTTFKNDVTSNQNITINNKKTLVSKSQTRQRFCL